MIYTADAVMICKACALIVLFDAFGVLGTGEAGLRSEICLVADEIHFVDEIRLMTDEIFASQRLFDTRQSLDAIHPIGMIPYCLWQIPYTARSGDSMPQ